MKNISLVLFVTFLFSLLPPGASYGKPSGNALESEVAALKKQVSELRQELEKLKTLVHSRLSKNFQRAKPKFGKASIKGDPEMGSSDAPLVLVEFSDYQCPFCGKFFRQTLPYIKKNYVDTGKIRFVFKDYPIPNHRFALKAAQAAHCAGESGNFWGMHDVMFENQRKLDLASLKEYAVRLGGNENSFASCIGSPRFIDEINADKKAGNTIGGVTGTPSFLIGRVNKQGMVEGEVIRGAKPFVVFQKIIDNLLKNKKGLKKS